MGFFGDLGNVLAGRPVDGSVPVTKETQDGSGEVVPVVRVVRVESPIKGNRLEVYITVRNESSVPVFVDKIRLLGMVREIDHDLKPGMSQEYPAYSGPVLHDEHHRDAELQYRTQSGKYFVARHEVRYQKQNDGLHVGDMRLLTPVEEL